MADLHARVGWWPLVAVFAGVSTFATERVRIAFTRASAFRWSAEWTLLSGHVALAVIALVLGTLAVAIVGRIGTNIVERRRGRILLTALVAMVPLVRLLVDAGAELSSGPWISQQWFAWMIASAPLVGALAVAAIAVHIASMAEDGRVDVAIGLAVPVLAAIDHELVPGLYPDLHIMLHGVMTMCGLVLGARIGSRCALPATHGARIAVVIGSLVCVAAPIGWLGMSTYSRAALLLRAPAAGTWIRHALPRRASTPVHAALADLDGDETQWVAAPIDPAGAGLDIGIATNVVFVVADTLRADALPPSRPSSGTAFWSDGDTPRLDAWIAGAYRFRHAYAGGTETKRAMPVMFRSIEVAEDPLTSGAALGDRLAALGLDPIAVVHRYFRPAKSPVVAALLDGFTDVQVYTNATTNTAVPRALAMLESRRDHSVALFLHLYTMHMPGFDGHVLGRRPRVANYRRSLRYLDAQIGALLDGLQDLGLRERTIVVLLGDHGEGLGDHGVMLHGPTTFEEDIRVPFAIGIPGHDGRIIDEPVGAIDFAPTVLDLFGAPPNPGDRGRSLAPLLAGEPGPRRRPYYFENAKSSAVGVVVGRDKLVYERAIDVAYRFDLAADPREEHEEPVPADADDRELVHALVGFQPDAAAAELERPETFALLRRQIERIDPAAPSAALPMLLGLVALRPEPDLVRRCVAIFDGTDDPAVRLLVLRHLIHHAPHMLGPRVAAWLEALVDTPDELMVVAALAGQGQPTVATAHVAARMLHFATAGAPSTWEPWLRLVLPWVKSADRFSAPIVAMLERTRGRGDLRPRLLVTLLDNAAGVLGDTDARIVAAATTLESHDTAAVRAAAARALGAAR